MTRTTKLADFRAELLATGAYRTHDACRRARRAKKGALTTFRLAWPVGSLFHKTALYRALGILDHGRWDRTCFKTVTAAESLGMNVIFEGWENRAAYQGPVVYVCNHLSSLETILLPPVLLTFGPYVVPVKESLMRLPFLTREVTDFLGLVGIGRKNPRADLVSMLRVGLEKLRAGTSFWVFPQGSRKKTFARKDFSSLGARVAEHARCPICPLVVDTRCLPTREKGWLRNVVRDFGPADTSFDIRCTCGPLIPSGKSRDMHEASFRWMSDTLESWGLPVSR